MNRLLITTGGTGGHIFPALAVAEEFKKRIGNGKILFIGGEYGQEAGLAKKAGIEFAALPVTGFLGRGLKALPAMFNLVSSIFKAAKIIDNFKPDVIAGFGGYASFAPMLAGLLAGKPCILHEQNAVAGASNKILAKLGAKVCATLPDTRGFSKIAKVTGNPVRSMFLDSPPKKICSSKHLLVLGGSQGSHALNEFMIEALPLFKKNHVEILHQCGKADENSLGREYASNGYDAACARSFIDEMDKAYAWADLILCRAGASTIAELCVVGLPAVFVPFPAAIHDHQTFNARILADGGAALLIPQKELSVDAVAAVICDLLANPQKRQSMAKNMLAFAKPHAAAEIVNILEETEKQMKK